MEKKKILFVLAALGWLTVLNAQPLTATLTIAYKGATPPEKVYLTFYTLGTDKSTVDSVLLDNGNATHRLSINDVTQVTLYDQTGVRDLKKRAVFYIAERKTRVTITDSLPHIVIHHSPLNKQYAQYKAFTATETEAFETLNEQYGRAYQNKPLLDSLRPHRDAAWTALDSVNSLFVQQHPDSWFSLNVMNNQVSNYLTRGMYRPGSAESIERLNRLFATIPEELKATSFGRYVADALKGAGAALVGRTIVDFAMPDKDGSMIDTKAMRGKVFLIDFWGSWCVWCRKGHPHLKALYDQYHPKGFEIIAIGVEFGEKETHRDKWLKAIAEDQLAWKHILNDNDVINLPEAYGVRAYPTKLLVDRDGKILLRVTDDNERALDAKLADLFDN